MCSPQGAADADGLWNRHGNLQTGDDAQLGPYPVHDVNPSFFSLPPRFEVDGKTSRVGSAKAPTRSAAACPGKEGNDSRILNHYLRYALTKRDHLIVGSALGRLKVDVELIVVGFRNEPFRHIGVKICLKS